MIAFISTMVSDPSAREFMTSFYEKYYRLMFSVSRGICKEYNGPPVKTTHEKNDVNQ